MVLHNGINIYEDNKDAIRILVKIIRKKSNSIQAARLYVVSHMGKYLIAGKKST